MKGFKVEPIIKVHITNPDIQILFFLFWDILIPFQLNGGGGSIENSVYYYSSDAAPLLNNFSKFCKLFKIPEVGNKVYCLKDGKWPKNLSATVIEVKPENKTFLGKFNTLDNIVIEFEGTGKTLHCQYIDIILCSNIAKFNLLRSKTTQLTA